MSEPPARQRVLVTGGAGFIGSHLVESLLGAGHEVTVLDDFSTGKRGNLPEHGSLTVVAGDVADPAAVRAAVGDQDAVVHLAAVASVEASVRDPVGTHRTNLEGSVRLFAAAAEHGVRRVVYASSASVYGDNPDLPLREGSERRPLTPYAIDKLAGEQYLAFYHRAGKLSGVAFRFFNVFGPRQDPSSPYSGVISIFLEHALRGAPLTLFGDGLQSRDFVYVQDVARALAAAATGPAASGGQELPVFNVGRGESVSLLDLVSVIEGLPGVRGLTVGHGPAREGDIRHSLADVRALRATGWAPRVTLADGLSRTVASLQDPSAS